MGCACGCSFGIRIEAQYMSPYGVGLFSRAQFYRQCAAGERTLLANLVPIFKSAEFVPRLDVRQHATGF